MTSSKFAAASLIALATLAAGSAFAGGNQPFAGEAPFFKTEVSTTAGRTRAYVHAEAVQAAGKIDSGEVVHAAAPVKVAVQTRAEVRAETRQAVKTGHGPKVGELS